MPKGRFSLSIWLYGRHIADLTEPSRYRYRLSFTEEALDFFGEGARVLSLAFPLSAKPITDRNPQNSPVAAFLEGLLPEGNLRQQIAATAGVATIDKMALLNQVGAECAGAVQFLVPGTLPSDGHVRVLQPAEVERLIADLPTYHLPDGAAPQASLAGIQDKILLTALPDGQWGWPEGGAASTHIIKPEPLQGAVEHLVQTEHWALSLAGSSNLSAARSELQAFDGRAAIVVERYDRTDLGRRLHQEDFCQALGLDPGAKYESTPEYEQRGSRLSRIAKVAADRARDPSRFRGDLLRAVTFNVIIGNGDAHSKNYSLLLDEQGAASLAPLYDTAPLFYLDSKYRSTGHIINGRTSIATVDVDDLVEEGASWGVGPSSAREIVIETMERVHTSVTETPLPEGAAFVKERLEDMWVRRSWAVPAARSHISAIPHDERSGEVWVEPYVNSKGTLVGGHHRRRPTDPAIRPKLIRHAAS